MVAVIRKFKEKNVNQLFGLYVIVTISKKKKTFFQCLVFCPSVVGIQETNAVIIMKNDALCKKNIKYSHF